MGEPPSWGVLTAMARTRQNKGSTHAGESEFMWAHFPPGKDKMSLAGQLAWWSHCVTDILDLRIKTCMWDSFNHEGFFVQSPDLGSHVKNAHAFQRTLREWLSSHQPFANKSHQCMCLATHSGSVERTPKLEPFQGGLVWCGCLSGNE